MQKWLLLFAALLLAPVSASAQLTATGVGGGFGASGGGITCSSSQGNAFLARLSGSPDNTHKTAYCTLIDGLVTDGVWSKLDALYMFAADSSANALLNLVSATGNATNVGATFTVDTGFAGNGSSTYVNTTVDPSTLAQFSQNSGHFSLWGNSSTASNNGLRSGYLNAAASSGSDLGTGAGANQSIGVINGSGAVGSGGTGNGPKHYLINRSGASAQQMYVNGANVASNTAASSAVVSGIPFWIGCRNFNGSANACTDQQHLMASIGSSLNGGSDAANFYARVHTYLQTIAGIP